MGTITAYTKDYMDSLIDSMIESGEINSSGELILTRRDATTLNAGSIIGAWTTSIAVATSTTRPGSPYTGQGLYETDTKRYYIYDGTSWVYRGGLWVCTSATRPAAPFAGLEIYETDTKRNYFYDGANWLFRNNKFICTAATRPTGGALFEGLEIYETDTDKAYIYDGANWVQTFQRDATAYTPVVAQGVVLTKTVRHATYRRLEGKRISLINAFDITSAGTASAQVTVTLPVAAADIHGANGAGHYLDLGNTSYGISAYLLDVNTVVFDIASGNTRLGVFAAMAAANGDSLKFGMEYEAASF